MDLVQIRWQQIRLAEASQAIARENIELKQKVAQLQIAKSAAKPAVRASLDTKILENIENVVREYQRGYLTSLGTIKEEVESQRSLANFYRETFRSVCKRYEILLAEKDSQILDANMASDQLRGQLEILNKKLHDRESSNQDEYAQLERKIELLLGEVESLRRKNDDLELTVASKAEEIVSLKGQRSSLEITLKDLSTLNESLRADINRIEQDSKQKLFEAEEIRKQLTNNYEKMIEEMSSDNQFLRNTIGELEEQIAKLSNSLVGNKSHFAKYVEVKSENIMLQSKLESLAGTKTKNPNFLPQLAGGIASKDSGPGSGRRGSADQGKTSGKMVPNIPMDRNNPPIGGIRSSGSAISPRVQSGRGQLGSGQGSSSKSAHDIVLSARSHDQLDTTGRLQVSSPHSNHGAKRPQPHNHQQLVSATKGHDKMSV